MDYKQAPQLSMLGVGAIILALTLGYYYFKKAGGVEVSGKTESVGEDTTAL